jgi:hypothetical protein
LRSYNKKAVISGDIIEIYEYENDVLEGYSDTRKTVKGRQSRADDEDRKENRNKTLQRARRDLRRLVNCNIAEYSKFVTLTFGQDMRDIKKANYEFKKFKQRLETKIGQKLQYVCVIEFTKAGRVHYHCVMFNLPYIKNKDLKAIWRHGHVKINKIDSVDNVGAYVCKYMSKDNDDDRLLGQKMYFSSRGLRKPVEIKKEEEVSNLAVALPPSALTFEKVFQSEYNSVHYRQYNINRRLK